METVAVIHRFETMPQTRAGLRAVAVLTQGHCFIRQRRDEALRLGMVSRSTAPAPPAPHLRGFEPARVDLGGILYAAIRMLDETGSHRSRAQGAPRQPALWWPPTQKSTASRAARPTLSRVEPQHGFFSSGMVHGHLTHEAFQLSETRLVLLEVTVAHQDVVGVWPMFVRPATDQRRGQLMRARGLRRGVYLVTLLHPPFAHAWEPHQSPSGC
jgi:hypothetical protein